LQITVEYGKPKKDESLNMSGTKTIIHSSLECLMQNEFNFFPAEIIENKKKWINKNVPQQRI
tara:strand:- start:37039 stop:37224 length:186 start_codon:yes stop_codon:yes gene_type:complete